MTRYTRNILALSALACAMVAHAQQGQTTGAVRGVVVAKGGGAIGDGMVALRNKETGFARNAKTGAGGEFTFSLLPPGFYEVTVTATGRKSLKDDNVRVSLGQVAVVNFEMRPQEVAGATVEVISTSQALDSQQMNSVSTVGKDIVENVPLVSRNFQDIAKLTPGVVQGNFNRLVSEGGRQIFNAVQIDGANNNSAFFGEQRGGAFIPFTFGADTIKELQVITNGFDAQYGQAGATVNAISRNGTNDFEGSTMLQLRKDAWAALRKPVPYDPTGTRNTQLARERRVESYNANFNVSGPIIKDKLFYFFGVERFKKNQAISPVLTGYAASDAADYTTFVTSKLGKVIAGNKGLTIADEMGNPVLGVSPAGYDMSATNTVYFGRLDWNASPDHRFVVRVNYTTMDDNLLNTSASQSNAESNFILDKISAISWVVESNNIWNPNLFTENRLQISNERRPMRANSVPGTPQISIGGGMATGTKTSTPRESNEIVTQFFSQTTWNSGDWTLKGGLDYFKADELNQFFQNNAGRIQFSTFAIANAWSAGTIGASAPTGTITYDGAISPTYGRINMWTTFNSVFFQGGYSGLMNKRLNLQFGVRYTKQDFSKNDLPNPNFAGLDQAVGNTSLDPRFAFTFDVNGNGKTIIRGGYGQFSSPTPLLIHSNTMNNNGLYTANYRFSLPGSARSTTALDVFNTGLLSANSRIIGQTFGKASDANLVTMAQLFGSTGSGSTGALYDPEAKLTTAKKVSLGIEHDLGNNLQIGMKASYVHYENLQYYVNVNLNQGKVLAPNTPVAYNDGYQPGLNSWSTSNRPGYAIIRGRRVNFAADPSIPGYPATGFGDVLLSKSDGYGHYRGLVFTVNKKWNADAGFIANLTLSRAQDTGSMERATPTSGGSLNGFTSGLPNSEIGAAQMPFPGDPASNYGMNWSDRFAVFNAVAYFPTLWGVKGSVRMLFQTGLPYTAMDGRDTNGDNIANHPVTGVRNDQRQPDYNQIDLRLSRTFGIWKKLKLEVILDVYNVFNFAYNEVGLAGNTAGQVATLSTGAANPAFGKQTDFWENSREVQLGLRFKF